MKTYFFPLVRNVAKQFSCVMGKEKGGEQKRKQSVIQNPADLKALQLK